MKEEINNILFHLECEDSEIILIRDQLLTLSAQQPEGLQQFHLNLFDFIKHSNIHSHRHVGFYFLFLGCVYYEQDHFTEAINSLQTAATELWGTPINKALAHWLLGLCFSSMEDFPNARYELQSALELLATHKGINSARADREHRSRQSIRQKIQDAYARLFNAPLFRDVRPDPAQRADRYPVQDPPTDEKDAFPISINMPISVTNENHPEIHVPVNVNNENSPVNKVSFQPPSPDPEPRAAKAEQIQAEREPEDPHETRTDDDGYLAVQSIQVFQNYARAGATGEPEPVSSGAFSEFRQINIEGILHTIHPLKPGKRVSVTRNTEWGWIRVKGKSMNNLKGKVSINNGDYVLFQKNPNADDNDIVIAVDMHQHSTYVKRYKKSENMLHSETTENGPEYDAIDMAERGMKVMGIVYAVAKPVSA